MTGKDATASALAAAASGVAKARAAAARGAAQAEATYTMSHGVLEGKFVLLVPLAGLETLALGESLRAYAAVTPAMEAAFSRARVAETRVQGDVAALYRKFEARCGGDR